MGICHADNGSSDFRQSGKDRLKRMHVQADREVKHADMSAD